MSSVIRASSWLCGGTLLLVLMMVLLGYVVEEAEGAVAAASLVSLGDRLAHAHAHGQQVGLGLRGQGRPEDDGGLLLLGTGARCCFAEERSDLSLGRVGGGARERALGSMGGHDAGGEWAETCMSWMVGKFRRVIGSYSSRFLVQHKGWSPR